MLSRLSALKKGQLWREAGATVDEEFQRLIGAGPEAISRFSEAELLAKLIQGEPTQVVHQKALMLTTLLKEAGDVATAEERAEESRAYYLKALYLLLDVLARGEVAEFPEFVPRVEALVGALSDEPLPPQIQVVLMQHYERAGEFGKAEDALFGLFEAERENPNLLDFGIAFYERLKSQSDASLSAGNLPRAELEASLGELRRRKK